MAVYFDQRCQAPYPGQNTDLQFHKSHPILAVANYSETSGATLTLYQEEGESLPEAIIRKTRPASALQWHPVKKILAIAWETGEINIRNEHENEVYEVPLIHKAEVTVLHWSSNGTRLVTGDASGLLLVWKADTRGRLQQAPLASHNIGEQLTQIVLRPPPPIDPNNDLASLARAAVSGDEAALDKFTWQSKKKPGSNTNWSVSLGPQEALSFFVGGKSGTVFHLNESGKLVEQFKADGPVRKLLYYDENDILVTVTSTMMLTQHFVSQDGDVREMLKVKLSGRPDHADVIWAGKGILATCTGEAVLRLWDLEKEENYILNLEGHSSYDQMETITCIAYSKNKGVLAGGTGAGHVAMWKYSPAQGAAANRQEPEDRWKLQSACTVDGPVSDLTWGSQKNLLAVNTVDEVYILSEQLMSAHCSDGTAVVQIGPMKLSIDVFSTETHHDVKTDIKIKGVYTTKEAVAIWDGKKVVVYEVSGDASIVRAAGTFSCESPHVCVYEQNTYTLEPGKVQVRTFQGTVKQLLSFTEAEGDPVAMEICTHYLVVCTSNGYVRLFDLSRREAKAHGNSKAIGEAIHGFGCIVSAKCNSNASKVSILVNKADGAADPRVYVWDLELDSVHYFNFETGRGEQDEYDAANPQARMDLDR